MQDAGELSFAQRLLELSRQIAPQIIEVAPRSMKKVVGDDAKLAMSRAVTIGLVALFTPIPEAAHVDPDSVARFVQDVDVIKELAKPLSGDLPSANELSTIFGEAIGRSPKEAGFDFDHGVNAFGGAFERALCQEPTLTDIAPLTQARAKLREGNRLSDAAQQGLDAVIAQLRTFTGASNTLTANDINAQNVVVGVQQIVHQHFYAERVPKWEAHYLRTLIARCDPLDLALLEMTRTDESGRELAPVRISSVFTTLNLRDVVHRREGKKLVSIADAIRFPNKNRRNDPELLPPSSDDLPMLARLEEGIRIPIVDAIAALPCLVILSQPGGGKSSVVNHVAVQLARRRLNEDSTDERLPGWDRAVKLLPVRIILREFAEWLTDPNIKRTTTGDAGDVWDFLSHQLHDWGCDQAADEVKAVLVNDGGIVFFDGLDEVRTGDADLLRETIKNAIVAFSKPLKHCKIVLTCREYAYQPSDPKRNLPDWRLPQKDFPAVTLAPLDDDQIASFLRDWYRVVGPRPPRLWEAARCQQEADLLHADVRQRPYLHDLAENPLLLTLMAQVHGRDGTLPNDRADLYERAVRLLLERWEGRLERDARGYERRIPGVYQQIGKTPDELRATLQRIAFEAHAQQGKDDTSRQGRRPANIADAMLLKQLATDLADDWGKAKQAADFIQRRAGLLVAQTGGIYTFPHRTFQEYLAARHMMLQGEPAKLLHSLLVNDLAWWREVFLLAAGTQRNTPSAISQIADRVLADLLATGAALSPAQQAQAVLVEQALHETQFVKPAEADPIFWRTRRDAQTALLHAMRSFNTLSPRERAQAGNGLARLGDPRFDPDRFYLPVDDEGLLGFVRIPADPNFKIGTRAKDFKFVMKVIGEDEKFWDTTGWRCEINDDVTPTPEFYIARYPVTVAQWEMYRLRDHADAKLKIDPDDEINNVETDPVVFVSRRSALAYCDWINGQVLASSRFNDLPITPLLRSGEWHIALPDELEWEKAARGGLIDTIFPWGNEPDSNRANYKDSNAKGITVVGCFPPNGFDLYDLIGNVWEWTRNEYVGYGYENGHIGDLEEDENDQNCPTQAVERGGDCTSSVETARCVSRYVLSECHADESVGFRLAIVKKNT